MSSRRQNEKKYRSWKALPNGGRIYQREFGGRSGGSARYFKEVDSDEQTVHFWQEIYDGKGTLVAIHDKFPVDKGHRKV